MQSWWLIVPAVIFVIGYAFYVFLGTPRGRGIVGEWRVRLAIGKSKPERQYVLNDYTVSVEGKSSQIDHIVIRENGIFVIETKNYSGRIYGNESAQEWIQVLNYGKVKNKMHNPLKQNATHIYRLKKLLPDYRLIPVVVFVQGNTGFLDTDRVVSIAEMKRILARPTGERLSFDARLKAYTTLLRAAAEKTVTKKEHLAEIAKLKSDLANNVCPRCGGRLVERHGSHGTFYGCENYPHCRFIKTGTK